MVKLSCCIDFVNITRDLTSKGITVHSFSYNVVLLTEINVLLNIEMGSITALTICF